MNSTPPSAESTSLLVLIAVAPRCSPTRSARCASTTAGRASRPRAAKIRPRIRATVVLPVPGGPVKTKCRAWRLAGQALLVAQPRHPQLRGDLAHLPLDRLQADQLVQLRQRAFHRRRVPVAAQPRGQLRVGPLQVRRPYRDQVVGRGLGGAAHHPHVPRLAGLSRSGCGRTGRSPARRRSGAGPPPRTAATGSAARPGRAGLRAAPWSTRPARTARPASSRGTSPGWRTWRPGPGWWPGSPPSACRSRPG